MSSEKVQIRKFLSEILDNLYALWPPIFLIAAAVVVDTVVLWLTSTDSMSQAAVSASTWFFGNGAVPAGAGLLDIGCLMLAGFLGYVFLGLVLWAVMTAARVSIEK